MIGLEWQSAVNWLPIRSKHMPNGFTCPHDTCSIAEPSGRKR